MDPDRQSRIADKVRRLVAHWSTDVALPGAFYTDPEIYDLELERVVHRHWILVGHTSEWAEAGNFRRIDVAGESALVVRGDDGELRAVANVCRHRGSRVCLEAAGTARNFTCPYHGWTYDRSGRLVAARDMPGDFDASAESLVALPLEILHGLVFVAFSSATPGVQSARRDLEAPMRWFGFERLKVATRRTYAIPANWKLAVENYQECYHCATAHRDYATRHTLMLAPARRPATQATMLDKLAAAGLEDVSIDRIDTRAPQGEMGYGYSRTALIDGYLTGSRDGRPLAPLLGTLREFDGGASDFSFGAFSFLLAYSDHVVAYVFTPVTHGTSQLEITWFVRDSAREGIDYDLDALTWLWDTTTLEDVEIIRNHWLGVQSRHYVPGRFSTFEAAEREYVRWLVRELTREASA